MELADLTNLRLEAIKREQVALKTEEERLKENLDLLFKGNAKQQHQAAMRLKICLTPYK